MCPECGGPAAIVYGPERVCYLCMMGSVASNGGIPDLTDGD